ncbi:MAG: energy-coupling factor ABC transporter permease [Methanosphaera sp.]|nr:energy-coupling factor ABC transporter permease [Methanosphaera sp.]
MHIMEGYLPLLWCVIWFILAIPVVVYGIKEFNNRISQDKEEIILLLVSGLFMFFMSLIFEFPSVTGSCSHACGTGLSTVFFGPSVTAVVASLFIFLQAIIFGYGGLTTLGANILSMGIVGPVCGYFIWKQLRIRNVNEVLSVLLVTIVINIMTCVATAVEFALSYPDSNVISSFVMFLVLYVINQIPLLIIDCIFTTIAFVICLSMFKVIKNNNLLDSFDW